MNAKKVENPLLSFDHHIVNGCNTLPTKKPSKIIKDQLLRSSFSAVVNHRNASKTINKKALISKLSIVAELADKTPFRAAVIQYINLIPVKKLSAIIKESTELSSNLAAAGKTFRVSLNKS